MYLGHIMEYAPTEELFDSPLHPYTQALFSAIPSHDPGEKSQMVSLPGDVPSPANIPAGCAFHTRCPHAMQVCREQMPEFKEVETGHRVSCWLYE